MADPVTGSLISQITPAIASGVMGIGQSIIGNAMNRSNMDKQVRQSKELMNYQWDNFMSPRAQAKSYADAGLNPAVIFGQGGQGAVSAPSASMPSSSHVPVDLTGGMDSIANYLLSVSQAKKAGMDTKLSEQDIKNKQVQQQRDEFQFELEKEFGKHDWIAKIANEYMKLILSSDQSDLNEQEKALNELRLVVADIEKGMKSDEAKILRQRLDNNPTVIALENRIKQKQGDMYQAQANEANASAFEHKQRGNLIISQKEEQDFYNLVRTDPEVRNSLIKQMRAFGVAAEKQNSLTSKQIEAMDFAISQAAYADDMKEYTYWIDKCTSILTSSATVAGAAGLLQRYSQLNKALGSPKVSETVNYNAFGEQSGRSVTTSK